jgi:hypothetical protein
MASTYAQQFLRSGVPNWGGGILGIFAHKTAAHQ